jgi:short-subunit dehydrogenase
MSEPRVMIVTGATNGIGEAAAVELARRGNRVGIVARNPTKAAATVTKIKQTAPDATVDVFVADLAPTSARWPANCSSTTSTSTCC